MTIHDDFTSCKLGGSIDESMSRLATIGLTAALIPLSFVDAPYPEELVLQHVPSVLAVMGLAALTLSTWVSRLSFVCMVAFLWIHALGARWIYSFVPYDDWASALTGTTVSEQFGWHRNHYDRLVHFASGILGVPPASELIQRVAAVKPKGAAILAISVVLSLGALYEILEWQIAMCLSPAQAEAYNGQQGDIWDPQKDLALATAGALLSAGCLFRWAVPHSSLRIQVD